ncbi:Rv3235 family protein [Mycobacterium sp. ML4]
MPVIDYEPPALAPSRCRPSSLLQTARPARVHSQPASAAAAPLTPQMRDAAVFADAALRRVLEVIDRRRPAAQLRSVLAPALVDSVLAVSRAAAGAPGAAVLRRMRVQPAGGGRAAEVFGTYSRGERVHAVACRVEQLPTPDRWLVVALHIG